jgi:SAM-dependent methyltransferase
VIAAPAYAGHRILEAMRSAPRYADAIYRLIVAALPPDGSQILDFGAGDGAFAERFRRDRCTVDCVEPDPANRQSLAAIGFHSVPGIADLPAGRYDFIYTVNVLEHLEDLSYHVAELCRVLRPGGRLFVFVPAFTTLWTSLDDEVGHVRRFTRRTLTLALADGGFAVEESRYFDSLGFIAALGVRLLEKIGAFRYSPETVGFYDRVLLPASLLGDGTFSRFLGKNVVAVARKPPDARTSSVARGSASGSRP